MSSSRETTPIESDGEQTQNRERHHVQHFSVSVDGRVFKCARHILESKSGYFQSLFSSEKLETATGSVDLPCVSGNIFADILEWMSTGHLALSDQNVFELLPAADYLDVRGLLRPCKDFLLNINMTHGNCDDILRINQRFKIKDLLKRAMPYLLKHFNEVCTTEAFYSINADDLISLVKNSKLVSVSEDLVVECILHWVHYEDKFERVDLETQLSLEPTTNRGIRDHPKEERESLALQTERVGAEIANENQACSFPRNTRSRNPQNRAQNLSSLLRASRYLLISADCLWHILSRDPLVLSDWQCLAILEEIKYYSTRLDTHQDRHLSAAGYRWASPLRGVILAFYNNKFHAHDLFVWNELGLKNPTRNLQGLVYFDRNIYVRGERKVLYVLSPSAKEWHPLTGASVYDVETVAMVPIERELLSVFSQDGRVYHLERISLQTRGSAQWTLAGELTVRDMKVAGVTNIGVRLVIIWTQTDHQGPHTIECYHLTNRKSFILPTDQFKIDVDFPFVTFKHDDEAFILQGNGNLWRLKSLQDPPYISVTFEMSLWVGKLHLVGAMIVRRGLWLFEAFGFYGIQDTAQVDLKGRLGNVFNGVRIINSPLSLTGVIHAVVPRSVFA